MDIEWYDNYSPSGEDERKKLALMEQARKTRQLSLIPEAIGGIGDVLATANKAYGVNAPTDTMGDIQKATEAGITGKQTELTAKLEHDPMSDTSRQYQSLLARFLGKPSESMAGMSAAQIKEQIPAIEKLATLEAAKENRKGQRELRAIALQTSMNQREQLRADRAAKEESDKIAKDQKRQEDLEKQAQDRMTQVRGDRALQSIELQRDAAITAYNRLNEIKQSGRGLNPIDYTDILGQIYKARTGTAPTDTVLKDIHQATLKGNFGKAYTLITGNQAPATTQAIADSLQQMAASMGHQTDQLHEGYMTSRLSLPKDLEPERAERISKLGRGMSFKEATGLSNDNPSLVPTEVRRQTKDGRIAIFDANTKKFLRYE